MPLRDRDNGVRRLGVLMRQGGVRAVRAARLAMRRAGDRIEKKARRNAPVDHHGPTPDSPPARELERSIQVITPRDDNNRIQVIVTVGGVIGGVNVDDYAMEMHEGDYQLGPESRRKQARDPEATVGPKYLERAYLEHADDLPDEIADLVMRELGL